MIKSLAETNFPDPNEGFCLRPQSGVIAQTAGSSYQWKKLVYVLFATRQNLVEFYLHYSF